MLSHLSFLTGNFDPKATCNFYDNIEPGPVVPPKPYKKGRSNNKPQLALSALRNVLTFFFVQNKPYLVYITAVNEVGCFQCEFCSYVCKY